MTYSGFKITRVKKKRLLGLNLEANDSHLGMNISLGGIVAIEEFSDEVICLKLKRGYVVAKGEFMNIVVFEEKRVEIEGVITELYFEYDKKRRSSDCDKI